MRRWILLMLLACASCSAATFRPRAEERRRIDDVYVNFYTATFQVACDSCRVEYGIEGSPFRDVVEGGWTGSVQLGALADDDRAYVYLRVRPYGEARVLRAQIDVNGQTVRSGEGDEPGDQVNLRARVP